jgi:hypothetical protein
MRINCAYDSGINDVCTVVLTYKITLHLIQYIRS